MWPFRKRSDPTPEATPAPTLKSSSTSGQIRELHLRLLDLEGDFDKVLTQLKRFGARLARRDEREVPAAADGAEVVASPLPPQPPPAPPSLDRKSGLRAAARQLRLTR